MDPKLTEVSQLFERFKAGFVRKDFDTCTSLLSQLKVLLTGFRSLPPLFEDTPSAVHDLTFAINMSSQLATILLSNKLTGENYVDWKHNLDIVLTHENHKMVLTRPCPLEPFPESGKEERGAFAAWKRSDEIARCYILASMSNVLQQQHRNMETAADMMYNLAEMFGYQTRQVKQAAVRKLMNCRMKSGTPVRTHMLKVIGLLNDMEIMGAEIDGETQVDMVLVTLPETFDNFKLNYFMNKLTYNLAELTKELQVAEALFSKGKNKQAEVHLAVNQASTFGTKRFKPKRSKKAFKPPPKPKKDQSDDRCHHCNQMGHWKRNCPKYLEEIKCKNGVQGDKKA